VLPYLRDALRARPGAAPPDDREQNDRLDDREQDDGLDGRR
jgi:hypothetical protein